MSLLPCLLPAVDRVTGAPPGRFGDPLVDAYLEFLVARVRPNSVLAGKASKELAGGSQLAAANAGCSSSATAAQPMGVQIWTMPLPVNTLIVPRPAVLIAPQQ